MILGLGLYLAGGAVQLRLLANMIDRCPHNTKSVGSLVQLPKYFRPDLHTLEHKEAQKLVVRTAQRLQTVFFTYLKED